MHPIHHEGFQRNENILYLKLTENKTNKTEKPVINNILQYRCIVCQFHTVSLPELHFHQSFKHTSEELSLSIIKSHGLLKYVEPKQENKQLIDPKWNVLSQTSQPNFPTISTNLNNFKNEQLEEKQENKQFIDPRWNNLSQTSHLNFSNPNSTPNTITNNCNSEKLEEKQENKQFIDPRWTHLSQNSQSNFSSINAIPNNCKIEKLEEPSNLPLANNLSYQTTSNSHVPRESLTTNYQEVPVNNNDNNFERWKKILNNFKPVNDEDFNKCINELCLDLEDIKKKKNKRKLN